MFDLTTSVLSPRKDLAGVASPRESRWVWRSTQDRAIIEGARLNRRFLSGAGFYRLIALVMSVTAMMVGVAGPSGATANRHASITHQGPSVDNYGRRFGDYTVNLHTSWAVEDSLPRGTKVTATYISTPGGCTTAERNASFTIDTRPWYSYDFNPLFVAKSSGSCAVYASYADYNFEVTYPAGDSHENRIRIEEDGTSGKYQVVCVRTFLSCYPGLKIGTNASVEFRRP